MAWCGGLALTTDRSMILATRIIQRGLDERRPITEALLRHEPRRLCLVDRTMIRPCRHFPQWTRRQCYSSIGPGSLFSPVAPIRMALPPGRFEELAEASR